MRWLVLTELELAWKFMRFAQEIRGNLQVDTITVLQSTGLPEFQLRDLIIVIALHLCFMKAALPVLALLIWESL
jgi:hypothetical protein